MSGLPFSRTGAAKKHRDFTLWPSEVGPNGPLYKFKGRRQRDKPTASRFWAAQGIGFVKERYPDVAQILGLVHLSSPTVDITSSQVGLQADASFSVRSQSRESQGGRREGECT